MRRINCCKPWHVQPVPQPGLEVTHIIPPANSFGHTAEWKQWFQEWKCRKIFTKSMATDAFTLLLPKFSSTFYNWKVENLQWTHWGGGKLSFLLLRAGGENLLAFDVNIIWYTWLSSRPVENERSNPTHFSHVKNPTKSVWLMSFRERNLALSIIWSERKCKVIAFLEL